MLSRPDLGTLQPGAAGDASVLTLAEGSFAFADVKGETVTGSQRLTSGGVVIGGAWWDPA